MIDMLIIAALMGALGFLVYGAWFWRRTQKELDDCYAILAQEAAWLRRKQAEWMEEQA